MFRSEDVGLRFSFVSYGTLLSMIGSLDALEAGSDGDTCR